MNKEELVKEVAKLSKYPKHLVEEIITCFGSTIKRKTATGTKIKIVGFGTFERRNRSSRTGRNPRTGETIVIQEKKLPLFTASKKFKDLIYKKQKL